MAASYSPEEWPDFFFSVLGSAFLILIAWGRHSCFHSVVHSINIIINQVLDTYTPT